jgi:hypothetical protein
MKLTLSVGGGFTGLVKQSVIELEAVDAKTKKQVLEYFKKTPPQQPVNMMESWVLDEKKEVAIVQKMLSPELRRLYLKMKKNLQYLKH